MLALPGSASAQPQEPAAARALPPTFTTALRTARIPLDAVGLVVQPLDGAPGAALPPLLAVLHVLNRRVKLSAREQRKHEGSLPIIGVNTFTKPESDEPPVEIELARATEEEKRLQVERLAAFHDAHREEAEPALARLKDVASSGGNTFASLMEAVRVCSLGQITAAFFEVGGQYRRNV